MNLQPCIDFKSNRSKTVTSILKSAKLRRSLSNRSIKKEINNKYKVNIN